MKISNVFDRINFWIRTQPIWWLFVPAERSNWKIMVEKHTQIIILLWSSFYYWSLIFHLSITIRKIRKFNIWRIKDHLFLPTGYNYRSISFPPCTTGDKYYLHVIILPATHRLIAHHFLPPRTRQACLQDGKVHVVKWQEIKAYTLGVSKQFAANISFVSIDYIKSSLFFYQNIFESRREVDWIVNWKVLWGNFSTT